MGFFEEAVSTAKTVGKSVGKRTEEILIISKKKLTAIELENKLEALYEQLGKMYYSILAGREENAEKQSQTLIEIDRITEELEQIKTEIRDLSNNR